MALGEEATSRIEELLKTRADLRKKVKNYVESYIKEEEAGLRTLRFRSAGYPLPMVCSS